MRRFESRVFLLFAVCLVVVLVVPTAGLSPEPPQTTGFTVSVATLNVLNKDDESKANALDRMQKEARVFPAFVPAWGFLGLQEVPFRKHKVGLTGPVKMIARVLPCGPNGSDLMAVHCFAKAIIPAGSPNDADQFGDTGFVVANGLAERVPGSTRGEHIGKKKSGGLWRDVTGARFKLKSNGMIVPFYSVHLSHEADDHERTRSEIRDLVKKVRAWYVPGDLTPVITGDFNCHVWGRTARELMYEHFMPVTSDALSIDLIWVGRPQSFPGTAGALVRKGATHRDDVMKIKGWTDHDLISTTLEYDSKASVATYPPPVSTKGKGCVNP